MIGPYIALPVLRVVGGHRAQVHAQSVSPNGQWIVAVIKEQKGYSAEADVWIRVTENSPRGSVWTQTRLDWADLWDDITPSSYAIEWKSDREFLVGTLSKGNPPTRWLFQQGRCIKDSPE